MSMENPEGQLKRLLSAGEGEVVEFKEAARNEFDFDKLGRYFTALANEARLGGHDAAWLVFGVDDKRKVVGTDYKRRNSALEKLKGDLHGEAGMTFRSITPFEFQGKRVILFKVPAVAEGQPLDWKGHYYGRAGDSLVALPLDKLDILRSGAARDWTAELVAGAGVEHIDEEALQAARLQFRPKGASAETVAKWPVMTFLERVGLASDGKINRAGILLLGKPEAAHLLSPHPAQITWKLDSRQERAYQHFGLPFLTATSKLYGNIRNVSIRILPVDSLLAREVSKYERSVLLEALHNCIAHQDYTRNARIVVIERPDELIFISEGNFFDGEPGDYSTGDKTPRRYRNNALAQAMNKLGMIDTMGYGIHSMYSQQAERWLPMPDYDVDDPSEVRLTIHGSILNVAFSIQLIENTDLSLSMIVALDRVQKGLPVDDQAMIKRLRQRKLIEGRKPNFRVSRTVAKQTSTEAKYIRARGQDDAYYMRLIEDYLKEFGQATRQKINELLLDKLGESLGEDAKSNKIGRLLEQMRRQGKIKNSGTRAQPSWELVKY